MSSSRDLKDVVLPLLETRDLAGYAPRKEGYTHSRSEKELMPSSEEPSSLPVGTRRSENELAAAQAVEDGVLAVRRTAGKRGPRK